MKNPSWLLTASVVLLMSGCTTFQSPKVLAKDEQSLSVGASMAYFGMPWIDLHVDFRTNVAKNLDAGIRLTSDILADHSAAIDAKYQLLTEPFFLALSTGAGFYVGYTVSPFVQVMLIGGTETFYVGVKPMMLFNPPFFLGGICSGLMLGDNKGLNIEANLVLGGTGSPLLTLGAGWRFFF
jgi:hypothetical protein